MTERPILMSDALVRSILAGRKTHRKLYAPAGADRSAPSHLARRLLNGIVRITGGGCWEWGRTTSAGYGAMTVNGRTVRVHRLAFALSRGVSTAKLTRETARAIRSAREDGTTQSEIAARFGVSQSTVSKVLLGEHWSNA